MIKEQDLRNTALSWIDCIGMPGSSMGASKLDSFPSKRDLFSAVNKLFIFIFAEEHCIIVTIIYRQNSTGSRRLVGVYSRPNNSETVHFLPLRYYKVTVAIEEWCDYINKNRNNIWLHWLVINKIYIMHTCINQSINQSILTFPTRELIENHVCARGAIE